METENFMKIVLQRVNHAAVSVDGGIAGKIGKGYLLLLGVGRDDTKEALKRYIDKIVKLRLFPDADGKTNLSLADVGGELLVVSQFTLYADCRKGNRPSFTDAAPPQLAEELYEEFIRLCREQVPIVEHGVFGADMKVELENDGPFTVVL